MTELLVAAPDGSAHPLVTAARAVDRAGATGLVIVDTSVDEALVARIEDVAPSGPVIVAPDPIVLHALGERLPAAIAGSVIVACTSRFEPAATAVAGSVASGALGLPWGIHLEALGDPRPVAEVALDLVDLAVHVTAARLLGIERLGTGSAPLVLVPELQHAILASITVLPAPAGSDAAATAPSTLLRMDSSHGQASADLLSPMLRAAGGPRRFGPAGTQLFLDAALAGSAPADLRLPAVIERLAPVLSALV